MIVDLPFPHKLLWPNGGHGKHYAVAGERKKHHAWAHGAALEAKQRQGWTDTGEDIPVRLIVHAKRKGPLPDMDNCVAASKGFLDGIAAALSVNDKRFLAPVVEYGLPRDGRFVFLIGRTL